MQKRLVYQQKKNAQIHDQVQQVTQAAANHDAELKDWSALNSKNEQQIEVVQAAASKAHGTLEQRTQQ